MKKRRFGNVSCASNRNERISKSFTVEETRRNILKLVFLEIVPVAAVADGSRTFVKFNSRKRFRLSF